MGRILVLAMMVCVSSGFSQTVEYTKRSKNEVRNGPGNYFNLLAVLPAGVAIPKVKAEGGWVNFQLSRLIVSEEFTAWISKNCLIDKKPGKGLKELKAEWLSPKASPAAVAAAIRGFAVRYGRTSPPAVDSLFEAGGEITANEYLKFKQGMSGSEPVRGAQAPVPADEALLAEYDASLAEEGIGLGIAARIAGSGLLNDPTLSKYVNLLAALLMESTGAYDMPLKIYITKETAVHTASAPGGYIFITKRMIEMCNDEAELAAVLAHEIMHLIYQHGMKEIRARLNNIAMDEAMAELDAETGQVTDEVVEELEDFAIEAYETVNKPRLLKYEQEADRGAALLLAKTGYDPMAVARMILAMRDIVGKSEDLDKENPFLRLDIQKRYDKVVGEIQKNLSGVKGVRNRERFRREIGRGER